MEHTTPEAIKKHVKIYISVFAALAALTVITVAVSYLHLPFSQAVIVALAIATLKASLVALFFMHLISEKQIIYWLLALTFLIWLGIFLFPAK
jgi:cytochrome c oxidase subunit 4